MTRKTSVELNVELLQEAQRILQTATLRETIEQAFREIVKAKARRDEFDALAEMRGMELDNPEIMAGAWRP